MNWRHLARMEENIIHSLRHKAEHQEAPRWHSLARELTGAENSGAVSRPAQVTAKKPGPLSGGRGRPARWGLPGRGMQGRAPGVSGS